MNKTMIIIATVTMFLFAGCATQKEIMIQEGHSLDYAEGFEDGCHSGQQAGGNMFESFKKDENRFSKHAKYTAGWSDGFRQCESKQEAMDRQYRMSIEQQRLTEEKKRNDKLDDYHLLKGVHYDAATINKLK